MNIQIKDTAIRRTTQKCSANGTRHTEYRDTGTTVRFDGKKKIISLNERHSNAHGKEDVLF
jgi:hypothetical protein